jgi:hypothetical protein
MAVNTMKISAGQSLEVLKTGWNIQKEHGAKISYMLHGSPGIGKTQVMEALARHVGGKLYDLRLTTVEPQDIRGLPHYDHENKMTVWYRPEDIPATDEPAVLFFDELTAASPFLLPTVYGILQERRVGQHKIPDNTIIVGAGNTVDDGAIAYEMGTAVADRLIHMYVQADPTDWIDNFAVPAGLHTSVTAFIKTRPDLLETTKEAMEQDHIIACTPRSWERVSTIMKTVTDRNIRNIMVAGTIGEAIGAEFSIIADDIAATVQVTEMVKKSRAERIKMYPHTMHGLNAMVFGLLGLASKENLNEVVEIMVDMRDLVAKRPDAADDFKKLPLKELQTHGFESLIGKYMSMNLGQELLNHPAFQQYSAERQADGLE